MASSKVSLKFKIGTFGYVGGGSVNSVNLGPSLIAATGLNLLHPTLPPTLPPIGGGGPRSLTPTDASPIGGGGPRSLTPTDASPIGGGASRPLAAIDGASDAEPTDPSILGGGAPSILGGGAQSIPSEKELFHEPKEYYETFTRFSLPHGQINFQFYEFDNFKIGLIGMSSRTSFNGKSYLRHKLKARIVKARIVDSEDIKNFASHELVLPYNYLLGLYVGYPILKKSNLIFGLGYKYSAGEFIYSMERDIAQNSEKLLGTTDKEKLEELHNQKNSTQRYKVYNHGFQILAGGEYKINREISLNALFIISPFNSAFNSELKHGTKVDLGTLSVSRNITLNFGITARVL